MLNYTNPFYEIVIVGKDAEQELKELNKNYLSKILISHSKRSSSLPFLENRFIDNKTYIYVCKNNTCKLPVEIVKETLQLLEK